MKGLRYLFYTFFGITFLFFVLNLLFPLNIETEYSTIVTADDGTILHAFLTSDDKWRMYTELDEITPQLKKAIIHKEDKYFRYHVGVNPLAVARALFNNIIKGRRTSGASTITMQVARLLSPKNRTVGNKVVEMFRALQLEMYYSKDEILQMYLNLVPYGGNIEGVKAASVLYFQKAPDHLSIAEITALSIIPNRPTSLKLGESNDLIIEERNKWLRRFQKDRLFPEQDILDAIDEPINARRTESPKWAPHFCYRMRSKFAGRPIVKTRLNLEKQRKVQQLVKNHVRRLYSWNIKNGAAIVINNETKAVEAYIGSADFNNPEDGGQVDGIRAVRSPGSTLKPLLYALAFDEGLITPKTIVTDVPINFSGYRPENFDEKFNGNVTIEEALAESLNVPAVKILHQLEIHPFVTKLVEANFSQIERDRNKLGLSVALGGCGVNLQELSNLYSAYANEGRFSNLKWLQENEDTSGIQLLTPGAAFMLTEILTQLTRPDMPKNWQGTKNLPKVAWKTGTSYGRRDAWSIGYNKKYTVGVWVGNFSAKGVPELTGATCATPLLFDIFNAIQRNTPKDWYAAPESLDFRLVCSESGVPPADFCENQIADYYLPSISTNQKCEHKKEIWMSVDSQFTYCTSCVPEVGYIKKLLPNHLPEIITWFETEQISYDKLPPHNPDCERIFSENEPVITSPSNGLEYFIDKEEKQRIMLACNAANDVTEVFWYVNNQFVQSAPPTENVFFHPPTGKVKISCTDDKGRNSDIWVEVTYF